MEFLIQILVDYVASFFLVYPGGFILWILKGRPKHVRDIVETNYWTSLALGMTLWVTILTLAFYKPF